MTATYGRDYREAEGERLAHSPSLAHAPEVTDESEDIAITSGGRAHRSVHSTMEVGGAAVRLASSAQLSAQDTGTVVRSGGSTLRSLASVDASAGAQPGADFGNPQRAGKQAQTYPCASFCEQHPPLDALDDMTLSRLAWLLPSPLGRSL